MRYLKTKVDEETRVKRVDSIVRGIYTQAVGAAEKGETSFKMEIPKTQQIITTTDPQVKQTLTSRHVFASDPFFLQNMTYILSGLQKLFLDCTVSNSTLSQGTDGKFYDISTLDEKVLPFVNRALDQSFIVIDWS
jgi:hypothetical protein